MKAPTHRGRGRGRFETGPYASCAEEAGLKPAPTKIRKRMINGYVSEKGLERRICAVLTGGAV